MSTARMRITMSSLSSPMLIYPRVWMKDELGQIWRLLATPVPHAAALSNAAQSGAVVRGGDALERMAHVNHILLDKTGTLTSGKPKVGSIVLGKGRRMKSALQIIMGLEARSNHPYATTIVEHCKSEAIEAANIKNLRDIEAGVAGEHGKSEVAFIRPDAAKAVPLLFKRLDLRH